MRTPQEPFKLRVSLHPLGELGATWSYTGWQFPGKRGQARLILAEAFPASRGPTRRPFAQEPLQRQSSAFRTRR
jgi:hypothetical protein